MNACAVPNGPAWSDEAISHNWEALREKLPDRWLPIRAPDAKLTRRPVFDEYGCGSYGCVYPTRDPEVVFKLTSDPTEADFVALTEKLRLRTPGIVRYHEIFRMEGERNRTRMYKRTHSALYCIIRESAEQVGEMESAGGMDAWGLPTPDREQAHAMLGLLKSFKEIAGAVRHGVQELGEEFARHVSSDRCHDDPADFLFPAKARRWDSQVDLHLPAWWPDDRKGVLAYHSLLVIAKKMEKLPIGFWIGSALRSMLLKGMLLADVHSKNVGVVRRGRDEAWVITDPGHLVRLRSDLPRLRFPHCDRRTSPKSRALVSSGHVLPRVRLPEGTQVLSGSEA